MQAKPAGDLTIGVVGPHELVERVMLSGGPGAGQPGATPRRLVAAAYRDEQEASDKVVRLGPVVDVCLFASRVPHEYARKAGALTGPATSVPLNGSALYSALLRAMQDGRYDLTRVSASDVSVRRHSRSWKADSVAALPASSRTCTPRVGRPSSP